MENTGEFSQGKKNEKTSEKYLNPVVLTELFLKEFQQERNNIKEIIFAPASPDQNFSVTIEDTQPNISVKMKKEDGKEFDLNTLLPEGFKFRTTQETRSECLDRKTKEILVNPDTLSRRGSVLALLHEVGHTYQEDTSSLANIDVDTLSRQQQLDLLKSITQILMKSMFARVKKVFSKESTGLSQKIKDQEDVHGLLPTWCAGDYDKLLARNERDAWAYSLKKARGLEREGFDVFSGFESTEQVHEFVNTALLSHEISRLNRLASLTKDHSTPETFRPRFVRTKLNREL